MNYLAHIYLSGDNDNLKIGNFIADAVKGKQFIHFPPGIQKGIILHRAIDTYTDVHPVVKKSTHRLFPNYRHYSPVITDILYDHFLAANWNRYSNIPLESYVDDFYRLLEKNNEILPKKIRQFLPYMKRDNWLLSYKTIEGIGKILWQMNQRTGRKSKMNLAINDLQTYYSEFEEEFFTFFQDLEHFTKEHLSKI
ncbi:acyl carrier protein phosphodiesterase [soil metagenome]